MKGVVEVNINSNDSLNSSTKLAYNFLNKVKPIQKSYQKTGSISNWADYKSDTTYSEFKTALEKAEMVNKVDARSVDKSAKTHIYINQNYTGSGNWNQVYDIFEKAYGLGMVDKEGRLLHGYEASV